MNRVLSVMVTLVVGACASEWDLPENEDLLAGGRQVYVLEFLNYERQDPVITFEQVCEGVHRQTAERDTVELFPDGTARRATYVEHLADGHVDSASYVAASGIWISSIATVSPDALLNLYLSPSSGQYVMSMSVNGRTALSRRSTMSGVCNGEYVGKGTADFMYTKR